MAGNQIEDVTLLSISELLKNAQNSFDLAPRVALLVCFHKNIGPRSVPRPSDLALFICRILNAWLAACG